MSDRKPSRQIVLCSGPRCRARARLSALLDAALAAAAADPEGRWGVATYECLGRCSAGPNALIRTLPQGADPNEGPGYRELDAGRPLDAVDGVLIARCMREPPER